MLNKLKNLIRQSIITLITDDSENYPLMQVNYNGKTSYAIRVSPYGLCSNPIKDHLSLLFNSCGNESQKFGIPIDINRFKNLKEGETALYNSKTGSYVFLKEDGLIESKNSRASITIYSDGTIKTQNSNGDITLTSNGILELNGNLNSAIAFNDMKTAFDQLKSELNAVIAHHNTHGHQGTVPPNSTQVPTATADMSSAKIDTVKVP